MGKLIIGPEGKTFRIRRGKLVEIPTEWQGKVTNPQTIRKRKSKDTDQKNGQGNKGH